MAKHRGGGFRLGVADHKVVRAFVDHRAASSSKLWTDGNRIDGLWLGGARIAEWRDDLIHLNDLGSRAAQTVHRAVKHAAAPKDVW